MSHIALGRGLVGLGEEQRNIPVAPLAEPAFDAHLSTDNPLSPQDETPYVRSGVPNERKPCTSRTTAFSLVA
jgi:hypothetical protein